MNYKYIFKSILILSVMIFLLACSKETLNANRIIPLDKNNIKVMNITVATGNTIEISDKIIIEKVIDYVNNLKVKKISLNETIKVMDNGKKLSKDTTLVFQLEKDKKMGTAISIILFSEKELVISDQKTLPSISYLNTDDQTTISNLSDLYSLLFQVFNERKTP